METTITARHFEISDGLRQRADTIMARLENAAPRPVSNHIVFDVQGSTPSAEIRLHLSQGEVMVATGEGPDHRTALDRAEAKLISQLRKAVERPRRVRKPAPDQV
ncbi:MAG: HPF/RaiA family ribosome-associated protein [Gemmatimonadales bacterium]